VKTERQIVGQAPLKASAVRQPLEVDDKGIWMCAEASSIVGAAVADFYFNCRDVEIPTDECIWNIPRGVYHHAQYLPLKIE
jgi:hypothetical protein